MDLRNSLYDRGTLRSYDLGARTISVGNLTTGGTGKTPLVALIAKMLIDEGEKVCILTRGYGRKNPKERVLVSDGENILVDAEICGDEPVELALRLTGRAIIIADPDRVAAAKWAREKFDITAFILDDGFQHRRARRNLDIVCIDATNPCGNGRIVPAGPLRESLRGLARANAIVVTRCEQVESTDHLIERLRERNANAPISLAKTELQSFVPLEEFRIGSQTTVAAPASVFAFAAIGNNENFLQTLSGSGIDAKGHLEFRDHHRFAQHDIREIERQSKESGADVLVTTAKDAVKLGGLEFELPCFVAIAATVIVEDGAFRNLLQSQPRS